MYYTIYRITNNIDGKFYIGMHKTKNLDDCYIGSGKLLKRAIAKHGEDNFSKEILFTFDNQQEMIDKEIELITEELIKNPACYNLTVGGWGGNRITDPNHPVWSREVMSRNGSSTAVRRKENPTMDAKMRAAVSRNMKKLHVAGKVPYDNFKDKTHSEETKMKMREKKVNHGLGVTNSQFGSVWITDGEINKKIEKGAEMPPGFRKGRILKNLGM